MPELPAPPAVLCHPDGKKSCGACCGMYNLSGVGKTETLDQIRRRTAAFFREADVSDPQSLRGFRTRWETTAPDQKLLVDLPNCPFLGFLKTEDAGDASGHSDLVGCLVHPIQNDGIDGRDCGVYDRETCDTYLCAAHNLLREHEKALVIAGCSSSYLYGLVITDPRFVRELFEQAATLNGAMPRPDTMSRGVGAASAYFRLKVDWPYRAADGIFGQLHAGEGLDTPRRRPVYEQLGTERAPWDTILNCLGTEVDDQAELEHARALVASRVREFAQAVA